MGTIAIDVKALACKYTGINVNYKKTIKWYDGTIMSDAKCDGVIFRKLVTEGITEYFVDTDFLNGIINSNRFGVIGDGIADDTLALQRFFDFIAGKKLNKKAILSGKIKLTSKVIFNGGVLSNISEINCDAEIISAFDSSDEILRFNNFYEAKITGKLRIIGKGGTTYFSRKNAGGVVFNDCGRTEVENLTTLYFKVWGVQVFGSSSQMKFGYISNQYCGSSTTAGMGVTNTITTAVNSESSTSSNARTTLTFGTSIPTDLIVRESYILVNNVPFQVREINEDGTLSVYPQIPVATLGTLPVNCNIVYGGGTKIEGSDSGIVSIDKIDVKVGGFGILNSALYPASIGEAVFQFVGICHKIGTIWSSAHIGGTNRYSYYEACAVHLIISATGTYKLNYSFLSNQGLEPSKCFYDINNREFTEGAVNILHEGELLQRVPLYNVNSDAITTHNNTSKLVGTSTSYVQWRGGVINLDLPKDADAITRSNTRIIYLSGYNNSKSTIYPTILTKDATTKINGSLSDLTIGITSEVTLIIAKYSKIDNEWTVSWMEIKNAIKIEPSMDSATNVGATYSQTEVQGILDELRDLKSKMRISGILKT